MNKQQYMLRVKELEFALTEKTKEYDHIKSEFGRLKTAYKMSEKQIVELQNQGQDLPISNVRLSLMPTDDEIFEASDEWGFGHLDFVGGAQWVIDKIKDENIIDNEA